MVLSNIQHAFQTAYHQAEEMGQSIQRGVSEGIRNARRYVVMTSQSISQSCHTAVQSARQKCLETIEKTKNFVYHNKENIFFIACSCATAYFAPQLFFPVLIATIILRVEISHYLKKYVDENWKPERNPYKLHPFYGPKYVTSLDLTLGSIAAIDAIALGTLFVAGSWTVALIPALGGLAAGSSLAKLGLDIARSWNTSAPVVITG